MGGRVHAPGSPWDGSGPRRQRSHARAGPGMDTWGCQAQLAPGSRACPVRSQLVCGLSPALQPHLPAQTQALHSSSRSHLGSSEELEPSTRGLSPALLLPGTWSHPEPEVAALWEASHIHTQETTRMGSEFMVSRLPLAQRAPGFPWGSSLAARARCASSPTAWGVCLGVGEGPDRGLEIRLPLEMQPQLCTGTVGGRQPGLGVPPAWAGARPPRAQVVRRGAGPGLHSSPLPIQGRVCKVEGRG